MGIVALEIKKQYPFAQGMAFDKVGPYEALEGSAHFAFDPRPEANSNITDIGLAPQDDEGKVRCTSDIRILRPVDLGEGTGEYLSTS